jgi:hypothetical protein
MKYEVVKKLKKINRKPGRIRAFFRGKSYLFVGPPSDVCAWPFFNLMAPVKVDRKVQIT